MGEQRGFDFDHWAQLAQTDPDRFERDRRAVLAQALRRVPVQRRKRLRCLQWRIDQVRRTSGSPLGACIRLSRMMWDSVQGERGLAALLRHPHLPSLPEAQVIPLHRRRN